MGPKSKSQESATIFGKELLNVHEVALFLSVSKRQVYYLIADGAFNCLKVGTGIRVLAVSVRDFVNEKTREFDKEKGWSG